MKIITDRRTTLGRALFYLGVTLGLALAAPAQAQLDEKGAQALVDAVVGVRATALANARSNETLGRVREGSGIVIDARGRVLTIGYLVIEAEEIAVTTAARRAVPARVAGYDHATGLAVLEPLAPLNVKPIALGSSTALHTNDVVMTLPFGGRTAAQLARVMTKHEFSGSWEYLLDEALFTSPPTLQWAGTALIDRELKLVGVGSLLVRDVDAEDDDEETPGNMFVPIDVVKPILADLIARGKRAGPAQPWLGLATEELRGHLLVTRVSRGGPSDEAGVQPGDIVVAVGTTPVNSRAELYRRIWQLGAAGVAVPLRVMRGPVVTEITVKSIERTAYFREPVRR